MKCAKAHIWLQGYADGGLSPRRAKRVRRHLDQCEQCRTALDRLSELKTLLAENRSEARMDTTPGVFWSQIEARIRGEALPRHSLRLTFDLRWPRVLAWASTCTLLLAAAGLLWLQAASKTGESPVIASVRSALPVVDQIITRGPDLYAQAYESKQSKATIIWTEGMPVISLEL